MLQVSEVGGHQLNETQLLHEAIELLAGGVLPTNTTACYAIYFILTHPQVLVTLKRELAGLQKTADGIPRCEFSTDTPYLVYYPLFVSSISIANSRIRQPSLKKLSGSARLQGLGFYPELYLRKGSSLVTRLSLAE